MLSLGRTFAMPSAVAQAGEPMDVKPRRTGRRTHGGSADCLVCCIADCPPSAVVCYGGRAQSAGRATSDARPKCRTAVELCGPAAG